MKEHTAEAQSQSHTFPATQTEAEKVAFSTFAGVSLPDEPHHQGGAVGALGRAGECLDAQLMSFGLKRTESSF